MSHEDDGSSSDSDVDNVEHQTGRWTPEEHDRFLQGLRQYNKQWKLIADLIRTRTVVQVRTHAQKHFQKVARIQAQSGRGSGKASHQSHSISSCDRRSRSISFSPRDSNDYRRRSRRACAIAAAHSLSSMNTSDSETVVSPSPKRHKSHISERRSRMSSFSDRCRHGSDMYKKEECRKERKHGKCHADSRNSSRIAEVARKSSPTSVAHLSFKPTSNLSNIAEHEHNLMNGWLSPIASPIDDRRKFSFSNTNLLSNMTWFDGFDIPVSSTSSVSSSSEIECWCREYELSKQSLPGYIDMDLPFSTNALERDVSFFCSSSFPQNTKTSSKDDSISTDTGFADIMGDSAYDFLSIDMQSSNCNDTEIDLDSFVQSLLRTA